MLNGIVKYSIFLLVGKYFQQLWNTGFCWREAGLLSVCPSDKLPSCPFRCAYPSLPLSSHEILAEHVNTCHTPVPTPFFISVPLHRVPFSLKLTQPSPLSEVFLLLLFSWPVVSDSLRPHGLQHAWPSCPLPYSEVCTSSCPLRSS